MPQRRWLGATSMPFRLNDRKLRDGLMISLSALMDVQPKLRIIINYNDVSTPPEVPLPPRCPPVSSSRCHAPPPPFMRHAHAAMRRCPGHGTGCTHQGDSI